MAQYSAKLLFQWRPVRNGVARRRRVCEERIVTFSAPSGRSALARAKRIGKRAEYRERHDDVQVFFEFVGVLDLRDVSTGFEEGEVWWELVERLEPSERRRKLIPTEGHLDARRKTSPKRHLKAW